MLNFEDFIALHYDDERFEKWKAEFSKAGHFEHPLHWDDYKVHYLKIFPEYEKNRLPMDFLSVEVLRNLFRHMNEMPDINCNGLPATRTFAGLLKDILVTAYPDKFAEDYQS